MTPLSCFGERLIGGWGVRVINLVYLVYIIYTVVAWMNCLNTYLKAINCVSMSKSE